MRGIVFIAVTLIACSSIANAQSSSKVEVFGGYSYEAARSGISDSDLAALGVTQSDITKHYNLNGFNVSGAGYLTNHLGLTADFSGHYNGRNDFFGTSAAHSSTALYNITGGPQWKFTNSTRVSPFVHVLAGVAHRRLREELLSGSTSVTSFETATDSGTN